MSVVLSVEDVGPCRKQLKVEIPTPAVEAETQRIVREFSRRVKLPGFRKGKVPGHLIQQRFRDDIEREVVDRLVSRYWHQAQAESQLDPILPPEVDSVDMQEGAPMTFVATVEVRPVVELGDLGNFELPEPDTEPQAAEIEDDLEKLRREVAAWTPVERPAGQGDLVAAHLTELDPEGSSEPQAIDVEIGDPQIWEELSLALTGAAEGQESEFVRHEQDGEEKRERRFKLNVLGVKERELPPLDDDLAPRIGEFETLDALREALKERLQWAKTKERHDKREQALLQQLCQRYPLSLPERVVDNEVQQLLREYADSMQRRGADLESSDIDWQRLAQEARPQAERRVHVRLLLDAIAKAEDLQVTAEELESTLATIARAQKRTTVAVRQALDRAGRLEALRDQMLQQKTIRRLLGEEPESEPAPDSALTEATD